MEQQRKRWQQQLQQWWGLGLNLGLDNHHIEGNPVRSDPQAHIGSIYYGGGKPTQCDQERYTGHRPVAGQHKKF